jgi:hypothetical protein
MNLIFISSINDNRIERENILNQIKKNSNKKQIY